MLSLGVASLEDATQVFKAGAPIAVAVACGVAIAYTYTCRKSLLTWTYKQLVVSRKERRGQRYLQENYAPVVDEAFEVALEVEGVVPAVLDGLYIRNGPNPALPPLGSYHWFDGDGMLHAVRLHEGKATYCNRFIQTARLQQERALGAPLFMKFGDMFGVRGLAVLMLHSLLKKVGVISSKNGAGTGNTALVFHSQKLLALHEGDLPYQMRILCNGVLETMGRLKLKGWDRAFTAHPKLDPDTGKLHFFGYSGDTAPYLQYGVLGADGALEACTDISIPEPVMMHDFAITRSYAVFLDLPLVIDPKVMAKENRLPVVYKPEKAARIGLLPLGATNDSGMLWFELPAFFTFHTANAWEEEDGTVQVVACHYQRFSLELPKLQPEDAPYLYRYTLDPATGKASMAKMSDVAGEFPLVHPALVGRKAKFAYMAALERSGLIEFNGVAKMQLHGLAAGSDACVGHIHLPAGTLGGEAVFVPRHEDPSKCDGEDDGYLLLYVFHPKEGVSKLHVYDAKTMAQQPVASVNMRRRVPAGFHGTFVRSSMLPQQKQQQQQQ